MRVVSSIMAIMFVVCVTLVLAQTEKSQEEEQMKTTIACGKQVAAHVDITGSVFNDVNLSGSTFENVNLSKTRMHDINLSDLDVSAAQIGGAKFKHIGPPPSKDGTQARQRPVIFEEMQLCDSSFTRVDLSNVKIVDCNIAGMTIDGYLVTELIAAYKSQHKENPTR